MKTISIELTPESRYIVFSDCHRGDGSAGDEFARNSMVYKCALEHYLRCGFTYIELGDAEELWENERFEPIYITHTSVYELLRAFHDADPARPRYIKIWGNHDLDWKDGPGPLKSVFPGIEMYEAAVMRCGEGRNILLLHGHQADPACSGWRARISRFLVRRLWRGVQAFGIGDPTRAAENPGRCDGIDAALAGWARSAAERGGALPAMTFAADIKGTRRQNAEGQDLIPWIIVAGHTHRPVFESLSLTERRLLEAGFGPPGIVRKKRAEGIYYNAGSCVHPRCITGIEIAAESAPGGASRPRFTLVKWGVQPEAGGEHSPLSIARTVLQA